jgi:hypothetical protein
MFGNPPFSTAFEAVGEPIGKGQAVQVTGPEIRLIAYRPVEADVTRLLSAYREARTVDNEFEMEQVQIEGLSAWSLEAPPMDDCQEPCFDEAFVAASMDVFYVLQATESSAALELLRRPLP